MRESYLAIGESEGFGSMDSGVAEHINRFTKEGFVVEEDFLTEGILVEDFFHFVTPNSLRSLLTTWSAERLF